MGITFRVKQIELTQFIFLLAGYFLGLFYSCSKKVDTRQSTPISTDTSAPRLSVDSAQLHLSNRPNSSDSFTISSNITWTISYDGDAGKWIQVNTLDGDHNQKILVSTIFGNLADTLRRATITISGPNDSLVQPRAITVNQLPLTTEFPFRNVYGGAGYNVLFGFVPTGDGGYVAVGSSSGNDGDATGNHGSNDMWVIKLDAMGKRVWQHQYGGSSSDIGYSITRSQDGGYLAVGSTLSNDYDVSGNNGGTDIWVVKTDASGNKQWTKCYGTSGDETGYSVVAANDGGYIIIGGNYGIRLFKIDANGNKLWQLPAYGSPLHIPLAGWWACHAVDNGYVVVGTSNEISKGLIDTAHGGMDIWIAKIDDNGNVIWNHEYGGTLDDIPYYVDSTRDGGYLITGSTNSFNIDVTNYHGLGDLWVIKTDASGNMKWQKTYGGSGTDLGYSSANIPGGGYLIAGSTSSRDGDISFYHGGASDGWLLTLDAYGNLNSQKTIGGSQTDQIYLVRLIGAGKYQLAGGTTSFDGDIIGANGFPDGWMMKF